jgi:DNA modification methylase
MEINKIYEGDCLAGLKTLPDECIDTCVSSPPYFGLRDYGHDGQIGLEETPEKYVQKMVEVFTEVKRVLKKEGSLWLNLGDSYNGSGKGGNPEGSIWTGFVGNKDREKSAQPKSKKTEILGLKPKDLIGIPWMVAFALRSSGWYLRQDIIWHKPNPMPESVTDRCTKAHEYIFLLSKSAKYYYDAISIKQPLVDV